MIWHHWVRYRQIRNAKLELAELRKKKELAERRKKIAARNRYKL
jgi:hypothetical protein